MSYETPKTDFPAQNLTEVDIIKEAEQVEAEAKRRIELRSPLHRAATIDYLSEEEEGSELE